MSTAFRKSARKVKKLLRNAIAPTSWNLHAGDRVVVRAGRDKGQTGTIARVDRENTRVWVTGTNLVKRHVRGRDGRPGEIVSLEAPLHYSNVAIADPETGAAVRVCRMFLDDGTKVRVTRGALASGSVVPIPGGKGRGVRASGVVPADAKISEARRETRSGSGLLDVLRGRAGGGEDGRGRLRLCVLYYYTP